LERQKWFLTDAIFETNSLNKTNGYRHGSDVDEVTIVL